LGGVIAESVIGWRGLYWGALPLLLIAAGLVATPLFPKMGLRQSQKWI
jgi:hypothetical protein